VSDNAELVYCELRTSVGIDSIVTSMKLNESNIWHKKGMKRSCTEIYYSAVSITSKRILQN
jgi:hypothetical protein